MEADRRGRFRVYFCRASGEVARQILTHNGQSPACFAVLHNAADAC